MSNNKELINKYILEGVKNGSFDKEISLMILKEINQIKQSHKEDIAIIGIACKFPCADNAKEYWYNIKNGAEVIRNFPENRAKDLGNTINMKAGWLENIAEFDAGFFRISPKEAISMHPSQRLFLETAWEVIEDAGYANDKINGSKTGVYVGIDHTYQMEYNKMTDEQDLLVMTGSMTSVLASRIAYVLNLRGPNLVVDTACSSGLVATHLACKALKNKECTTAIAGGINLIRKINANFDGVESTDGRLSAFDKNSKGTVWGEGVGFVMLKPLEQALKDKDNIYGVIKGSAINNDGATNGITAPSAETQAEVIVSAWEDAGINPETITYMEAHATGTVLGDPIEVKGIKTAFEKYTDAKQFCGIGSVKPNIGHGVSAAAISSLLKVILALKNKQLPPNINFAQPNPFIEFLNSPLYVNDRLKKWDAGNNPRRAGVSSFGFSRTNCHMILEEAPTSGDVNGKKVKKPHIFTISARSENALNEYLKKYNSFVDECNEAELEDICFTANTGRMHYNYRLVIISKDKEDFIQNVKMINSVSLENLNDENVFYGEHRIVPENIKQNVHGEITQIQKKEMSKSAVLKLAQLQGDDQEHYLKTAKEICMLYVKGAEIDWAELYKNEHYGRISLPTYPFEHKRYWMKQQEPDGNTALLHKDIEHPLVDRCLISTLDQEVYLTNLSVDRNWVLTEHLIMDYNVLPGTTYLEIAREAGKKLCGGNNVELRDVIFIAPLVVDKNNPKEVHTILKQKDGYFSFKIASVTRSESSNSEDIWIIHAEGKIIPGVKACEDKIELTSLRSRCSKYELKVDLSQPMGGFKFGPRWRNITSINVGEDEILTELRIQDDFIKDINEFVLHPALLDNAINLAIEKIVQSVEEGMYIPMSFKSIRIHNALPENFYSHQKIKSRIEKGIQTVTLDIELINSQGEILVEIEGYTIKKVRKESLRFAEANVTKEQYHELGWIARDIKEVKNKIDKKNIVVFKDEIGIADQMIEKLVADGNSVVEIVPGDCFRKIDETKYQINFDEYSYISLLNELKDFNFSKVIHMMSITSEQDAETFNDLEINKNRGVYSLAFLTRALVGIKASKEIELVLVSDYVSEVTKDEETIKPHNASLFALGRVVASEYNSLSCRSIDIDSLTPVDRIIEEINHDCEIYRIAYRNGKRYVEELKEYNLKETLPLEVEIKGSGVYLITGGMGGIGLEVAKYLAGSKVNLALVNRSSLPERSKWDEILERDENKALCAKLKTIIEIEQKGSNVICCSANVASEAEMRTLVDGLRAEFGRINGVVHSAGIAGEGILIRKDMEKFKKVLSPKIEGTWLLDKLTKQDNPDFFLMFSSILAVIGVMGQSDYAAANAYLNSFSAYRRKKGGRTATINWTVWSETGMALGYDADAVRGLFKAVTNARGMEAVNNVLTRDISSLIVGELDYERISASSNGLGINISDGLRLKFEKRCARIKASNNSSESKKAVSISIRGKESVNEIEMKVAQVWTEVLALDEVGLYESFSELGGDSIIATNLLKAMEKVFPGLLDISDMFTYPTIKQMAAYIQKNVTSSDEMEGIQSKMKESLKQQEIAMAEVAAHAETEFEIEKIMMRLAKGEISEVEAENLIENYSKRSQ